MTQSPSSRSISWPPWPVLRSFSAVSTPPNRRSRRTQQPERNRLRPFRAAAAGRRSLRCLTSFRCRPTPRRVRSRRRWASAVERLGVRAGVLHDPARQHTRRAGRDVHRSRALRSWRELGADGVVIGAVRKDGTKISVQVRLFSINGQQRRVLEGVFGRRANPRSFAHTIADEMHKTAARSERRRAHQAHLLVRSRRRADEGDDREARDQGDLHHRLRRREPAADHGEPLAEHQPVWSADGQSSPTPRIAGTTAPDIYISYIYEGRPPETPPKAPTVHNFLPAWSPDGTRIAFMSIRDGNPEIYVMNRDGSNLAPLHPSSGDRHDADLVARGQSDRVHLRSLGHAQIYIVEADGLGQPRGSRRRNLGRSRDLAPAPSTRLPTRRARDRATTSGLRRGQGGETRRSPRRRQQREPGLRAERPPSRVHVDARGQKTDLPDRPRRKRPAAGHEGREQ